jgi:ribonuclease HII
VHRLVGIDEVGRGCWAGPLVAGAAIIHTPIPGLNDSKLLSKKRRDELTLIIQARAEVSLGWVTPAEVDFLGLTEAVRLAMQRAIDGLATPYEVVIIDGNYNYLSHISGTQAIIKADGSVPAVSAASIVAKVARDTYMEQLEEKYNPWQFARHVGYGTALHKSLIAEHGICDLHRKSYKPIKQAMAL